MNRDVRAGTAAVVLVAVAAAVGRVLTVHASAAPLFGHWLPHVGPGSAFAVAIACLVVVHGPGLAARLSWRVLLVSAYLVAVGWTFALALVDGWQRGVAGRLTTQFEYLSEVPGVTDVPAMLRGFTGRIVDGTADPWTTHVAGHPPGALLFFVLLDRAGLGGGAWASTFCILIGASVVVSVPVTLRALGDDGRTAVPFLVLFPGAVWIGASADGLFAGVAAAGIALLAVAVTRHRIVTACAAGFVLASTVYLNYGLVLLAGLVLVVVVRRGARWPVLAGAALGALVVVAGFTAAGFWWVDGYRLVRVRYYQGLASHRPYGYWVWANLAALTLSAGPAAAPLLRRAVSSRERRPAVMLPLAAAAAILVADLSGLSKAETERIWLPFAVWLLAGAAVLPDRGRRGWLAGQAATALLVNHLVLTGW